MKEAKNSRKEKLIKVLADFANRKNILLYLTLFFSLSLWILYQETNLSPLIQQIQPQNSSLFCAYQQSKQNQFCTTVFFDQSKQIIVNLKDLPKNTIALFYVVKFIKKDNVKSFQDFLNIKIDINPLDKNQQIDKSQSGLFLEHDIEVKCFDIENKFCKEDIMFRQDLQYKQQQVIINANLTEHQLKEFDGMVLELYRENNEVLIYDRMVRILMIFFSVIFGVFYIIKFLQIPEEMKTFEHQFIFWLSIGLMVSNDPLYVFNINYYTEFVFFQTFQICFYILIVIFALSMLDRIYKEPLKLKSESLSIKLVILGSLLSMILVGLFLQFLMQGQNESIFQIFINNEELKYSLILAFFLFHIYLLYQMTKKIIRVLDIWDQILPRHKFLMALSISLLIIYLNCAIFQFFYLPFILINLYVITLQVGWQIPETDSKSPMFLSNKKTIQIEDKSVELQVEENYDETDPDLQMNSEVQSQRSVIEEI